MDSKPRITVLLLNYKREKNLPLIIDALKSQTIPCKIFLWNNAKEEYNDDRLDLVINSSENLMCWPRWSMAAYTDTEYIMTHDDDFCFNSNDVLEKLIESYEENKKPGLAIGFNGVKLGSDLSYYPSKIQKKVRKVGVTIGAKHHKFPEKDTPVDIVKGRLIFCRKKDIQNLPLCGKTEICDDIYVCGYLAKGVRGQHIVTSKLNGKVDELPGGDGEMAFSVLSDWEEIRSNASKKYFEK